MSAALASRGPPRRIAAGARSVGAAPKRMHHLLSLLEGALKYQLDWVCFYIFLFLACVAPRLGDGLFV
ncbi:MAG: hypothetical protein WBE97_15130, partial [Candidatus Acidiferrales bacterium]